MNSSGIGLCATWTLMGLANIGTKQKSDRDMHCNIQAQSAV